MFLGVTMAQAQDSLEALQKRKKIVEAETEAIQAETVRDEARKKQSELVAPIDPVKTAKDDAVEVANSVKAQPDAQILCSKCLKAAEDESKVPRWGH
jgi:hypothetical protein